VSQMRFTHWKERCPRLSTVSETPQDKPPGVDHFSLIHSSPRLSTEGLWANSIIGYATSVYDGSIDRASKFGIRTGGQVDAQAGS